MINSNNPDKEKTAELQRYLYDISFFISPELSVIPDGYYGPETAGAVKKFQQQYNIPVTGETDKQTWDTVAAVHKHLIRNIPFSISIFPYGKDYISEGSTNPAVFFLQTMLFLLHSQFSSFPEIEITGIYDKQTSAAVRNIQKLSLYPETGNTDKYTWNNIIRFFEHTVK